MSATIITLPVDAIIDRLGHGKLWARGWGVPTNPTEPTCLHGAIRFCAPVPGDAYLLEQVGARFGFGTRDNDDAADFAAVESMVRSHADITDDMLADTFGPQWEPIVALVRRAAVLTAEELQSLAAAWAAARDAAWDAAVADIGRIVNVDIARQQIEGGLVFGMGLALGAATGYGQGLPESGRLAALGLPLLADCPEIIVDFIDSTAEPFDPGELGVVAVAPAIANALFSAIGLRFRRLPLLGDDL